MVKGGFSGDSGNCGKPADARVSRGSGVSALRGRMDADTLPNQARYQLRYTRIFNFCHYTTAERKIKDFPVCGHLCGQSRFYTAFGNRGKSRKHRRHKALRRFALPRFGYRHGTPKPRALPSELHPVMKLGSGAGPEICGIIITDMAGKSKGKIRGENFQPPGGLPRSGMVGYNGRKELNKGVSR